MSAVRWGTRGLVVLGGILLVIYCIRNGSFFLWSGIICMLASAVLFLVKYRCPHCRRLLPAPGIRSFEEPEYCPYCGEALDL